MTDLMVSRYISQARYHYHSETKKDIMNVLNMYKNLRPILEKCTLPTGIKRELIVLKGTIPITYRKNVYNTPISIWVLNNHPDSAPICWVVPTKDMSIKTSQHVDQAGRVYLPYLSDWTPGSSDLLGVIQVMIIVFGEQPPLYSKPKNQELQPQQSQQSPVYPPGSSVNTPYPPYPPSNQPPYPPYPNVYPAINPIAPSANSYPPPPPVTTDQSANSSYPYPRFPMMPQPNPVASPKSMDNETITRLSLVSAVEDKLRARAREKLSQYRAEIDVLEKTSEDLKRGRSKLDNIVKEIETNLVELDKCKEKITRKDLRLTELVSKLESEENSLNIDEYFGPVQPLYKQLFNAFVEENSIIDSIFYLNEALQKNVIDLDIFIKYVRELSRRQFMLRALVKLCREKAGLPA